MVPMEKWLAKGRGRARDDEEADAAIDSQALSLKWRDSHMMAVLLGLELRAEGKRRFEGR
jgi:hypothetical protein